MARVCYTLAMTTICSRCAEVPAAEYSGKGPRPTLCRSCRDEHRRELTRNQPSRKRPKGGPPRPVPPCSDCGVERPPVSGRGGVSARCWECTRRYRSAKELARTATARPAPMCVDCGQSLPGRHGNTLRCSACHKSFRTGKQRERRSGAQGYVHIYKPDAPGAPADGWVLEHRAAMSAALGRALLDEETVHHINGVRNDNRPENLELWSSRHPKGQRVSDKVAWAKELLALYEPEALASC